MIKFIRGPMVFIIAVSLALGTIIPIQASIQNKSEVKKININTATLTELQKLPRIGEKVAQRIIDFRKEHGPFKKIEELMKVQGIGEKTFNNLKDLITVSAPAK